MNRNSFIIKLFNSPNTNNKLRNYHHSKSKSSKKWIINDCPPSLMLLCKFYRLLSFSFSGIVFIVSNDRSNNNNNDDHAKARNHYWLLVKHYSYLFLNLFNIVTHILALLVNLYREYLKDLYHSWLLMSKSIDLNQTLLSLNNNSSMTINNQFINLIENNNNNDSEQDKPLLYQLILSSFIDYDNSNFHLTIKLKTILNNIIKLLIIVSLIDLILILSYIIIKGGQLIRLLMTIPYIYLFDNSKRFAAYSLMITSSISAIISVISKLLYRRKMFSQLFDLNNQSLYLKFDRFFELFGMIIALMNFSLIPIMFIYTMMLFRFAIKHLMQKYVIDNKLDETNLIKLKTKLIELNEQFKMIIPWFAIPLTISLSSSIFIMISSACLLMINHTINDNLYISYVFGLGFYSLIRIFVLSCFGNLATSVCNQLIRLTYENLDNCSLYEWMCFIELKRIRQEFVVSIFSMYTVRQSSILAMLGFALNYIVILLQTENYSSLTMANFNETLPSQSAVDNDSLTNNTIELN